MTPDDLHAIITRATTRQATLDESARVGDFLDFDNDDMVEANRDVASLLAALEAATGRLAAVEAVIEAARRCFTDIQRASVVTFTSAGLLEAALKALDAEGGDDAT